MQDLIRNLPVVIYEYSIYPDGRKFFTYVSPSSEKILGLKAEDILKDASLLDSIIHEDDVEDLRTISNESYLSASELNWQGRMLIGGRQRWIEVHSNHECGSDGVVRRRGIIQDITERRMSAKESEFRYQSMVKKLPIGIIIHIKGKLVFVNDMAATIIGAPRAKELIGRDVISFVHPSQHGQVRERMAKVLRGEPVPLMEQKYLKIDGTEIDVESIAFPFLFKDQQAIQVIFRDISEKKLTEARIRKNETLFTQLFNSIPMAVVMLDDMGKVEQINHGFEEMFGYKLSELKGKNLNDTIVPDELRNEGIDLNNLITSNRIISVETIRRHKQGKLVNVILYGVPIMQDNQTIGIYGVYVDISDRKRVEEELKVRNAELDNFVYKVSHDLRAPLSSILGLVNLAKLPGNTDNPMDYIDIVGEKVDHLDHFITDVLSHSKNLKMEVTVSKIDLCQIIDRTFHELDYLQGAKELARHVKIEGIEFYNDPWRVAEIFRNLVSNAIKYRKISERVQPEVNIKIHVDNLRADISFADNGIGIEEHNLARIFDMFYRATEQSDGSGIGLYIVKNAIEKLGGQISVASRPGQGTRFNIILPNRINSVISRSFSAAIESKS